jgi:hypothetical protein
LPKTQLDESSIKAPSTSQKTIRAYQTKPHHLSPYFYTYSFNTFAKYSFSVVIMNVIGSPKSHRHLIPLVRDLIEAA